MILHFETSRGLLGPFFIMARKSNRSTYIVLLIILLLGTATYWVTDTSVVSTDVVDIGDRKKPVTPP